MKRTRFSLLFIVLIVAFASSFSKQYDRNSYTVTYHQMLDQFRENTLALLHTIESSDMNSATDIGKINNAINDDRRYLKAIDFWLRYLEPVTYKKINGPLPVEWETEVFEKFEKPYKREGAGLTLAALYSGEDSVEKDSLLQLVRSAFVATETYLADSITRNLLRPDHFYFCNRLYLLNLAAIYTTGFECPDTARIIPELRSMLQDVASVYRSFNQSFPGKPLSNDYLSLYNKAIQFALKQPALYSRFDHFTFTRDYINPLFRINQQLIDRYEPISESLVDYSLNRSARSVFSKDLYTGQSPKGVYMRVNDDKAQKEIDRLGKLLFYDPILSGNNKRSCASCHNSATLFTDTTAATAFQYNRTGHLSRNTPSLVNAVYNHLLMQDGSLNTLQEQCKAVISNPDEMGSNEKEMLNKVMSCPEYKVSFEKLLPYTPRNSTVTADHIVSAITSYYSKFSRYYSSFDEAMNKRSGIAQEVKQGYNLFMSKAQCGTCHFVPQFNGVKPPYIGSEFEVLGVPADTAFSRLSDDIGRYAVNPSEETFHAFRTGTIRNIAKTGPYMHNGVFRSLEQVMDFYNNGGGAGRGLKTDNQTLSSDSLKLTKKEIRSVILFMQSLNEKIQADGPPAALPRSVNKTLNNRKPGGEY